MSRLRISLAVRGVSRAFARIDLDQDHVARVALAHQRRDGRVAGVAAVPVGLAVDLDRLEHRRQAGRGEQHVRRDFLVAEHPSAPGVHVGRGDEELDRRLGEMREIDALLEDLADRIKADRVEVVGRDDPRHQVHHEIGGRCVERPAVHQPVERRALERAELRRFRDAAPIGVERRPRALGAALHEAADQHGGVHRAGGRAGDRLDLQPRLFEQPVEHAPGERAMRAAALQREVDEDRVASRLAPPTSRIFRHLCPAKAEEKRSLLRGFSTAV